MKGLTMTRRSRKNQRRVIASILTGMFIVQQTMTLTVCASEISGITGVNGVFNINPEHSSNGIGYRHYEKFNLSQGDIANLNYADISQFVNMVDSQININGIVNTVKNGNFYNGKAVFVSPNGMVVGASGVLNVGSLGVYAPSQSTYTNLVNKQNESALSSAMNGGGGAAVTINGKVISSGDVILKAGNVTVGQAGGIVAGVNANKMSTISSDSQATTLFNNLVNTDNLTTGNEFASTNGVIEITSNQANGNATGVDIAGKVVNYNTTTGTKTETFENSKGETVVKTTEVPNIGIYNNGNNGINISGTVASNKGVVKINNNSGDLTVSGTVKNNGTTQIFNVPAQITESTGYTSDVNSKLTISGNVDTQGTLTINNTGTEGMDISGNINHSGDMSILNGVEGTTTAATERNAQMKAMNITGNITTTNGTTTITNHAAGGMKTADGTISTNGLTMLNTGAGGMTLNGTANNNGTANVTNKAGAMNIGGSFTNTGDATFLNDGTALNVTDGGVAANKNGTLNMTNNGDGGFTINGTVKGTDTTANIQNNAGKLLIAGKFDNSGNSRITNDGTTFDITGAVSNRNGKIVMTNNKGGLDAKTGSVIDTNGLEMINNGDNGLTINGTATNNGTATVTNNAGELNVGGTFTNSGDATFTNNEGGVNFNVDGTITNKNGTLAMVIKNGGLNINSTARVNNTTANDINITNTGSKGVNVKGLVNAGKNVKIKSTNSNVTIGDTTTNDNYVTAGNNININVTNGSLLNYGVEKVLLKAGNDLTMNVTDGTIGLGVQQTGAQGTGIGPKAQGARDFTKSINANVKGKVNATTTNTKAAVKPDDLVINYAAIDSDMNIDHIKADGRVILTVDDDYGNTNTGTRYNMVNARPNDNSVTNVEGWGISLISNGSIGTKDNKVTFIQTDGANYAMDALTNENIYLKENSFNDANYGRDKEVT